MSIKISGSGGGTTLTDSASLASAISDETGTGAVVLSSSPTIVTPTISSFANATHNHTNAAGGGTLSEAALALTDVTTANASASAHGFLPKLSGSASDALLGDGTFGAVATLPVADTTAIVKGSADATKLVRIEADGLTTGNTRVWTAPDSNTSIPVFGQTITYAGPTAARTVTYPDANFTAARIDAAQTFTGNQTFSSDIKLSTFTSIGVSANGVRMLNLAGTAWAPASMSNALHTAAGQIIWSSGTNPETGADTWLGREAAGVLEIGTASAGNTGSLNLGTITNNTANGATLVRGSASESLTLNTGGASTVTAGNLAPANAIIRAIAYRITTTITTATAFTIKITGGNVFNTIGTGTSSQTTLTANTTNVLVPAAYGDQFNAAATTLTVDTTGTPGGGVIRLTVWYDQPTAPSS